MNTRDLLPPPNLGLSLGLGAAAAVAGAAAWAALIVFANRELVYLALGIGALVGFAMVKGRGHGQMVACCAAVLAVLSIGTGKFYAYRHFLDETVSSNDELFAEYQADAKDWASLGKSPSDEQVDSFVLDHGYEAANAAAFRHGWAKQLEWLTANTPDAPQWHEHCAAVAAADYPFVDYLKEDFHLFDILFVGLGLATAYSLVMRHTQALQVAAGQQLRAAREAGEAEGTAAAGDN